MQLGGLAGMAGSPQPNAPAGGDVSGLLELLQQHPNLPSSFITGLLGAVGQASAAQQAKVSERRTNLQSLLTGAAMQPGTTPEMLSGLATATAPNLAAKPFGQNLLQGLTSALPDAAATTIAPEDIQAMQTSVATLAATEGATLHDAIVSTTQAARLGGAPEDVIEKMKQYITSLWAQAKGWEPTDTTTAPEPAPTGVTGAPLYDSTASGTQLGSAFGGQLAPVSDWFKQAR